MEVAALGEGLEGAVERLIPPAAREAVLGDLRETCSSRGAYLREILKTAPFVIVSQMLRHLNLPVLMLQAALMFWFFPGWVVALAVPGTIYALFLLGQLLLTNPGVIARL